MEKLFIENRKGLKMVVVIEENAERKGLAFVMHGLGGRKEEPHLVAIKDAFREKGFTTVMFDTTNTFGESEGDYENATVTNYYEDLEDVIAWSKQQSWYKEPFVLAGHSLGGISTVLYAERHPGEVRALAPISTVVSGNLSEESLKEENPEQYEIWERTGYLEERSVSRPEIIRRLKWHPHIEDRKQYDLLPEAAKLTMPMLFIVGSEDSGTPYKHQKLLHDAVAGPKEIHIIEGAPHTFRTSKDIAEVKKLFLTWIDSWIGGIK